MTQSLSFTTLNRRWLTKMIVLIIAFTAFGCWGLYDSFYLYPKRGREYAQDREKVYLERLSAPPGKLAEASVADPKAVFESLEQREKELVEAEAEYGKKLSSTDKADKADAEVRLMPKAIEYARFDWLRAHRNAWTLSPEHTAIPQPAERLKELTALLNSRDKAVPLDRYDLYIQWGYMIVGFGLTVAFIGHVVRTKLTRFAFDQATNTLTLPGGATVAAADLIELDRRKWHKFYVTLITRGGKSHELDLYRFDPLEEWVLVMERAAGLAKAETTEDEAASSGDDGTPASGF